jgi:hypothetical protein
MPTASSVKKVETRRTRGTGAGKKGQLDRFDDGTWEFFGNGETTTADVAGNIVDYERKQGNDEYRDVRPEQLAQLLLEDPENAILHRAVDGDARRPIPVGQSMVAEGDTLKRLVGMLMVHERQLRETLLSQGQAQQTTSSEQILGRVAGGGLALPYEP